ncbi:glycosyltransferase family 39 protein [Catenulispora acidiphila]|nr:glycosyltransferase family 39 protein [Catenulispora acidiphila]
MRVHEEGLPVGGGLGPQRLTAAVATVVAGVVPHKRAVARPFTVRGEPLRRVLPVVLGLLAVAASLVVLVVARAPQLSIVDEAAHADYAYQVSHGSVPAKGAIVDAEIRYEWYCHDLGTAVNSADCAAGFTDDFQADAQDYTFGDPPLYYAVTGYLGRALSPLVPGAHDFITAGRVIGALWLFAGMLVLYLALRAFRVEPRYAGLGAVLLPLCPGVLAAASSLSSDAPSALCGAAALYVLARVIVQRRTGWLWPFAVTALTTGTKILNGVPMLVVGAVALVLAAAAWRRGDRRGALRTGRIPLAVMIAFCLVYGGWTLYQSGRGQAGWVNPNQADGLPLTGSAAGDLLSNMFGTFQHLTTSYWLANPVNGESVVIWATLLCVVLGAAPFVLMTTSSLRTWGWQLGLGTAIGISVVALVVETQVFATSGRYFAVVTGRYALSFLPWAIACLAVVASRRRLARSGVAFTGLGLTVMLLATTGLFTLGPALSSRTSFLIG